MLVIITQIWNTIFADLLKYMYLSILEKTWSLLYPKVAVGIETNPYCYSILVYILKMVSRQEEDSDLSLVFGVFQLSIQVALLFLYFWICCLIAIHRDFRFFFRYDFRWYHYIYGSILMILTYYTMIIICHSFSFIIYRLDI